MNEVIDFFFTTLADLWSLIISNWILSAFVLITVLYWIAGIYQQSRQK